MLCISTFLKSSAAISTKNHSGKNILHILNILLRKKLRIVHLPMELPAHWFNRLKAILSCNLSIIVLWIIKRGRPITRHHTSLSPDSVIFILISGSPHSWINMRNTIKPMHIRYSCSIPANPTAIPINCSTVSPTSTCIVPLWFLILENNIQWMSSHSLFRYSNSYGRLKISPPTIRKRYRS